MNLTNVKRYGPVGNTASTKVAIIETETKGRWEVFDSAWLDIALKHSPTTYVGPDEKTKLPMFSFPEDRTSWKQKMGYRAVQVCGFTSTRDYLEHILGVKLHSDDRNWFIDCDQVDADGVPEHMTATILHALTLPYGIGVSRIRLSTGSIPSGDMAKWALALGRNPSNFSDMATTTEEFCESADIPLTLDSMRFDHGDEPLAPSVVAEILATNLTSQGKVSQFAGTGHTSYLSPRGHSKNFVLSLQFDRLENIHYVSPPPDLDYKVVEPEYTLNLWFMKADDGRSFGAWDRELNPPTQVGFGPGWVEENGVWKKKKADEDVIDIDKIMEGVEIGRVQIN
jgi:hypothetical protein